MADIASFRFRVNRQSIGKHALVVRFLRGARRLHPPRPPSVPQWDVVLVLKALFLPPFEHLASIAMRELTLKTALLLALALAKHIGDLHAFSVDGECIRFGPGDCSVTLQPRLGYVPKSLSTPLKAQVISLPALCSSLCPLCACSGICGFISTTRPSFFSLTSYLFGTVAVLRDVQYLSRSFLTG